MATRGEFLFTGYLPTKGQVRVFQDLDNSKWVFAMTASGDSVYTTRDKISTRKTRSNKRTQPTLF